jgi:hypothetical protein
MCRMKLFFEPPRREQVSMPGHESAWESFVSRLSRVDSAHSLTDNRQMADAIIHSSRSQLDQSTVSSLLEPLSSQDVCQLVWDWGDKPTGRMSGFYCSLQRSLHDARRHRTMSYPIAFNELIEEFSRDDATYAFGFWGGMSARLRGRLINLLKPTEREDNSIIRLQGAVWSEAFSRSATQSKLEYVDFLRRTRFVICPRGYGVGSARLFEVMQAGRVPIIISDGYVLPGGIDWENCSIRIPEGEIGRIREVVKTSMDRWPSMAANARIAWEKHFSDGAILPYLVASIVQMRSSLPDVGIGYKVSYAARVAGALIGHHMRPALGYLKNVVKDRLGHRP